MTPLQLDLRRTARQLERAAKRVEIHGFAQGADAHQRAHHLGFDAAGAIYPRANHPSPAIATLAMWYAADAVIPQVAWPDGMAYSPRRVLEDWADRPSTTGERVIRALRRAAAQAWLDAYEARELEKD